MSEYIPPHQLIASDEYWGQPGALPKVPASHDLLDGMTGSLHFAKWGAVKVQGLYKSVVHNGNLHTPIEPGEPLPLLERGEGLIRIVHDSRKLSISGSRVLRFLQRGVMEDEPEVFDEKAAAMLSNHLYAGSAARRTIRGDSPQTSMRIWRCVFYLTGSKSGSQLEGISSDELTSPQSDFFSNLIMPSLVVGGPYKRNKAGTSVSKIVAAEVLTRGGKRARAPKKPVIAVTPQYALSH